MEPYGATLTGTVENGQVISATVSLGAEISGQIIGGPPGPAGAIGPQGPTGATGPTGSTGAAGAAGVVQSVVGGSSITVNSTNPASPIVNATPATFTTNGTVKQTVYNVRDYGAVGDGSTDDTTAIQNAINTAASDGIVLFPQGIYIISAPLTHAAGSMLIGSYNGSVIRVKANTSISAILSMTTANQLNYSVTYRDLIFDGNSSNGATVTNGIYWLSVNDSVIDHVRVINCSGYGIYLDGTSEYLGASNVLDNCFIRSCGNGYGSSAFNTDTKYSNCDFGDCLGFAWYFGGHHHFMSTCAGWGSGNGLFVDTTGGHIYVSASRFDFNEEEGVVLNGNKMVIGDTWVYNNSFSGNNAHPGITVGAAAYDIEFSNVRSYGADGTPNNQSYGLVLTSGHSNIRVTGGNYEGNVTGAILGATSGDAINIGTFVDTVSNQSVGGNKSFANNLAAPSGITLGASGIVTVSGNNLLLLPDTSGIVAVYSTTADTKLRVGSSGFGAALDLYHDGSNANISTTTGNINFDSGVQFGANIIISDGYNVAFGTSTGTNIGTATNQKLATYGATPVVQALATTDLGVVLSNFGTRAPGTAYPITTSGPITFTGTETANLVIDANNAVTVTSNAGTCSASYKLNTFTNSSAAAMIITLSTSTPADGQLMMVRVYDASGVAKGITWVNTENSTVTAPATSNGSTTLPLTVGFQWNSQTNKWRTIALC